MDKSTRSFLEKLTGFLVVFTLVFTILEGWDFYSDQEDIVLRSLLIFQNTFQAFLLNSTISLEDAIDSMSKNPSLFRHLVVYGYAVSQVTAPVVTAAALYRTIELFFRRYRKDRRPKTGEPVMVYGYNAFSRRMLLSAHGLGYRPYIVPGRKLTDEEELELLKHRIQIIEKVEEAGRELPLIRHFVLADEDIAADLSAFLAVQKKDRNLGLNPDCRFYIYYDDPGDRWLSEKVYLKAVEDDEYNVTRSTDIEFFDLSEIAARKATERAPMHAYQDRYGWDYKNFHMLIVGFGQMGQQLLMKALNQGVFCSGGDMTIDIVDHHARENSSLFFKQFRSKVERPSPMEYVVRTPVGDGCLRIRMHEIEARFQEFRDCLEEVAAADNPFTYGIICLNDNAASIQALSVVQDLIRDAEGQKPFPVVMRLRGDAKENLFIQIEKALDFTYCIPFEQTNVTLDDIFRNDTELEARKYNWIYNEITFSEKQEDTGVKDNADTEADNGIPATMDVSVDAKTLRDSWLKMQVFQRDSSRALYDHKPVKDRLLAEEGIWEKLQEAIGPNGRLLSRRGNDLAMEGDDAQFLRKLEAEPEVLELIKTEHRRWDYYMISQGWRYADVKNPDRKENPCIADWERLCKVRPDTCKYDLIPFLLYGKKPESPDSGNKPGTPDE